MRLSHQRELSPPLKDAGTEGATGEPHCRACAARKRGTVVLYDVPMGEKQRMGNAVECGHRM